MAQEQKQPPTIKDCFKESYRFSATESFTLREYDHVKKMNMEYDFARRLLFCYKDGHTASPQVIPFSQVDADVLETFREILIQKGGNPPALPHQTDDLKKTKAVTITRQKP